MNTLIKKLGMENKAFWGAYCGDNSIYSFLMPPRHWHFERARGKDDRATGLIPHNPYYERSSSGGHQSSFRWINDHVTRIIS